MGIGIWTDDDEARYYPLPVVRSWDNIVFDSFGGDNVFIYYDPSAYALMAERTEASGASWDGDVLRLSNGDRIQDGILYGADGVQKERDRPLQVYTRWYGFSLTFPATEIFDRRPISDE